MADGIFNIAKGAFVEKIRDVNAKILVVLLQAANADATLADFNDLAALLADAGNTEATFTNYARKTGLTGTINVDDTNDRVDVSILDQTWTAAGGATNNTLVKLLVCYEESASDAGRIPLSYHDFAVTTDGSDIVAQFNASGFGRAA